MNRKGLYIVLVALGIASGAVAQTVAVRSGEHEGFTRLVMLLPPNSEWSIDESARSLALTVDRPEVQFDVAGVFNRIPRTRLVALSQEGPGADLVFSLGCACSVSSFQERSGYLVIDIKDSTTNRIRPKPRRRALDAPTNQNSYRFAVGETPFKAPPPEPPKVMLPVVVAQPPVIPKPRPSPLPVETRKPSAGLRSNQPGGTLNISEERLLAQINRASDQGLLELRVKPEKPKQTEPQPGMAMSADAPMHAETGSTPPPVSLSATTVIDRDLAMIARSIDASGSGLKCLGSDRVALHEWGGTRPFAAEISFWRSQIFGEFDKVNPEMALGLARAYLHFGFGVEAGQAIEISMETNNKARSLKAMAEILDFGQPAGDNPFAGQQRCDSDVAMWAVFADQSIAEDINKNAVQMAFLRLPLHLRSYLGPKLSQIFTDAGDGATAKFILRAMDRVDIEPGSGVELAKAAVAELQGDSKTEGQELKKSLATGSEHSPEALVRLIDNTYKNREAVSPDLHDLAAAYALEYRNSEKGADLRRALAVALALSGQFDEAFEILADIEKRDGHSNRQSTLQPVLDLLSERADDVTFLRLAMISGLQDNGDVASDTSDRIARRLFDLGFAESASKWVRSIDFPVSEARRFLRAEIALKRRLPSRAMVELMGLTGQNAERLRAQAMWQEGDYQQAGQMLVAAEDFDAAARGFWMAENWQDVPEQANDRYAQIVAGSVELRAPDEAATQLTPLAEARALMQGSSSARAEIAGLLQAASVTPAPSQ